jgi:carboxypeptidase Q
MSRIARWFPGLTVSVSVLLACSLEAQSPATNAPSRGAAPPAPDQAATDPVARIRDEGLNRSQVMETLTYLTDVIGPRLTGSPNHKRANEWSRDKLAEWGLTNAQVEAWPFGRGWSPKRFSAQVVEPQCIPLVAFPLAWSCGADWPLVADVVYLDAKTEADLDKFKGQLKGAIVLVSSPRASAARFEPLASRLSDSDLLKLANAAPGRGDVYTWQMNVANPAPSNAAARFPATNRLSSALLPSPQTNAPPKSNEVRAAAATNQPPTRPPRQIGSYERIPFAAKEGAAVIVTCSPKGDGGSLLAQSAVMPSSSARGTNRPALSGRAPWSTNAPPGPPQITLAMEDYNRLVRMIERGEKPKMAVEIQVQFHTNDLMGYNTLAEIPGTDLKEELVMLGGHIDSWHVGTGATDDGAGVAVAMEAVRILQALRLQPRRTIRVGLWGGEEQGYLGSTAYLNKHFGYYTNATNVAATRAPRDEAPRSPGRSSRSGADRKLVRQGDYEKLSAYFNLDNGTGKIRGIYMQGNEGVRPFFRRWMEPFRDLGAETLTTANTGGTDHIPFNNIGLPGFQFIQDPIDYMVRTHHTTADVSDRIQADDLKQAAVIMAAFVYDAAMEDEKLPRKSLEPPQRPPETKPEEPPKPVARSVAATRR